MSKPASAAMPPPTLQLHVLVVPPTIFEGQNLEQEFSVLMTPELENVQPNGQVAHAWIGPVLPIRVWESVIGSPRALTCFTMTYFMGERVWGMRSIGICADASMWKK